MRSTTPQVGGMVRTFIKEWAWKQTPGSLIVISLVALALTVYTLATLKYDQNDLSRQVQTNALWTASRTDRQTHELLESIAFFLADRPNRRFKDVATRFDILISGFSNLDISGLASPFKEDRDYLVHATAVMDGIRRLNAKYSAEMDVGAMDRDRLEELLNDVDDLRHHTTLMSANAERVEADKNIVDHQRGSLIYNLLIAKVIAMALMLCTVILMLRNQIRSLRATQQRLEWLNRSHQEVAQQADAGSRAKSVFLATMSHEIRTPLNGIIGSTELFDASQLNAEHRKLLGTIRECGTSLLELINDILDFSWLESGSTRFERRRFELGTLIESAVEIVSPRARQKNLGLIALYPEGTVEGDETRLRQVLVNLTANAVKFTEKGDVAITVKRIETLPELAWLRFEVRDTGIGISAAAQSHLFEEFNQLNSSVHRRFGGSGLGLAISRRLVQAMGGKIGVESAPGKGSCFWFQLPVDPKEPFVLPEIPWPWGRLQLIPQTDLAFQTLQRGLGEMGIVSTRWNLTDGEPSARDGVLVDVRSILRFQLSPRLLEQTIVYGFPVAEPLFEEEAMASLAGPLTVRRLIRALTDLRTVPTESAEIPTQEKPLQFVGKVLVVEDNQINQLVSMRLLEKMGLSVEVAQDGVEAIERVKLGGIDLVLMDMELPVMGGLEATRNIRQLPTSSASVFIVGLTANAFSSDRDACFKAGMNDFISKPVNRQKLESAISRLSDSHSLTEVMAKPASEGPPT
jgi:two-component system, sensor histidine kinase and response regulator